MRLGWHFHWLIHWPWLRPIVCWNAGKVYRSIRMYLFPPPPPPPPGQGASCTRTTQWLSTAFLPGVLNPLNLNFALKWQHGTRSWPLPLPVIFYPQFWVLPVPNMWVILACSKFKVVFGQAKTRHIHSFSHSLSWRTFSKFISFQCWPSMIPCILAVSGQWSELAHRSFTQHSYLIDSSSYIIGSSPR